MSKKLNIDCNLPSDPLQKAVLLKVSIYKLLKIRRRETNFLMKKNI